jgi:signal transduction histidine kinase
VYVHHAARMDATDEVLQEAVRIAHEINNLITAISGFAELTVEGLTQSDPIRSDLEEIRSAASRAGKLTPQLLAICRRLIDSRR